MVLKALVLNRACGLKYGLGCIQNEVACYTSLQMAAVPPLWWHSLLSLLCVPHSCMNHACCVLANAHIMSLIVCVSDHCCTNCMFECLHKACVKRLSVCISSLTLCCMFSRLRGEQTRVALLCNSTFLLSQFWPENAASDPGIPRNTTGKATMTSYPLHSALLCHEPQRGHCTGKWVSFDTGHVTNGIIYVPCGSLMVIWEHCYTNVCDFNADFFLN